MPNKPSPNDPDDYGTARSSRLGLRLALAIAAILVGLGIAIIASHPTTSTPTCKQPHDVITVPCGIKP